MGRGGGGKRGKRGMEAVKEGVGVDEVGSW